MFKGNASARISTSKSKDQVHQETQQQLSVLGNATISDSGIISIPDGKFTGFGYKADLEGRIVERDGSYTIDIDCNAKPEVIAWLIAICFFPIGLAIFVIPYNVKEDIQKKSNRALADLKFELEKG